MFPFSYSGTLTHMQPPGRTINIQNITGAIHANIETIKGEIIDSDPGRIVFRTPVYPNWVDPHAWHNRITWTKTTLTFEMVSGMIDFRFTASTIPTIMAIAALFAILPIRYFVRGEQSGLGWPEFAIPVIILAIFNHFWAGYRIRSLIRTTLEGIVQSSESEYR